MLKVQYFSVWNSMPDLTFHLQKVPSTNWAGEKFLECQHPTMISSLAKVCLSNPFLQAESNLDLQINTHFGRI